MSCVFELQSFNTLDEALELANGVKYGLAASVWTKPVIMTHVGEYKLDGLV
jgi:acyl-CoA reductase-like NAD-dependent aldehyde dehydrogenase